MEDIQGTWVDRRTGKSVFVRDMIMDGDQMVIMTSMGAIPPDTFSNYFVKMSEEDYGNAGIQPELTGDAALAVINNGLDTEEKIVKTEIKKPSLDEPLVNNNKKVEKKQQITQSESTQNTQNVTSNTSIIKKVFDKMQTEPEIAFSINIEEWPIKELKMLVNVLDIPFDEISDYIITTYLNKNTLSKCFSDYLREALENDK